jgi:hypothetical protein
MHNATSTQRRSVRLALVACAATALIAGAPAAAHAAPEPTQAPAAPTGGLLDTSTITKALGLDLDSLSGEVVPEGTRVTQNELSKLLGPLGAELSGVELGNGLSLPLG